LPTAPTDAENNIDIDNDKSIRPQAIYIPFEDLREVFEK
jgi:hypothetical protein